MGVTSVYEVSFWGDENAVELGSSLACREIKCQSSRGILPV